MRIRRRRDIFLIFGFAAVVMMGLPASPVLAETFSLPFDPFMSPESFGCKHLLVPGAEILPRDPVVDPRVLPGWKSLPMKDRGNRTIESLVIKGSMVVRVKGAEGRPSGDFRILIPAGGLVYDATPLEAHLPVGDRGVIFGHRAQLLSKNVQEETCRQFSVLAGRSFPVGDQVVTYLAPGPKGGPMVLWRTLDGVSIRPHPLTEYPVGQVPGRTPTRIFGVYTHAGQIAEYESFSAPIIVAERWRLQGKKRDVPANSEWFPHFRAVPISCPIGHHIGLMVYNEKPILLAPGKVLSLYDGYLKIQVLKISAEGRVVNFSLNGRSYTGRRGIDSLIGEGRAIEGIKNSLDQVKKIFHWQTPSKES